MPSHGNNLTDIDVLSGSYGADAWIVGDIGPDVSVPLIQTTVLMQEDQPITLSVLGEDLTPTINKLFGGWLSA